MLIKGLRDLLHLDPAAPDAGGGGAPQTPDGASIIGAGGEDYGAPPVEEAPAESAGSDLWGQPPAEEAPAAAAVASGDGLPDDHWAREHGISTQTQLRERFAAASGVQTENQALRGLLERVARANAAAVAPAAPAAPAAKPGFDWYGFGTRQAYQTAVQADPEGTLQRIEEHRLEQSRKAAPNVEQMLEERLAPYEQTRREERLAAQYHQLVTEEPTAKVGTPEWNALRPWLEQNTWHGALAAPRPRITPELAQDFPQVAQYLQAIGQAFDGVNLPQVAFRLSTYPLLKAKLEGAAKRVQLTGAGAAAARPGAARTAVPSGNDVESQIQQDIEMASKAGVPISEATISNLRRMYQKG